MFLSKILTKLPGVAIKQLPENRLPALLSYKQFSSDVPSTEIAIPDKLFKKVEVEVRGNDSAVLKSYEMFATTAAKHLGITIDRVYTPKKPVHERLTLLKSKHVHKKHRVQYETRTYYKFFEFVRLTGSTADTFLEYIQRNLPEGVAMKVTKTEIQRLPESVSSPPTS